LLEYGKNKKQPLSVGTAAASYCAGQI